MDTLLIEKKRNLATITLNRPDKMNAITMEMMRGLRDAFKELENDSKTTVILIQGAGDKSFSAGVDSKEILTMPPEKKTEVYHLMKECSDIAMRSDKILIAALNGYMLGMGAALALAADIRIAVNRPEVYLQFLEIDVGMFPLFVMALGFYHFPPTVAARMVFGGEKLELAEMKHYGFIDSICAPEDFEKEIRKVARVYTNKRPEMIRLAKECYCKEREILLKQVELEHGYAKKFYETINQSNEI
jgi:enoyl-CoA hydratase